MKTLESPVEYFSGTVVLPDFLTLPQCVAFERAMGEGKKGGVFSEYHNAVLPAILDCVKEWHIKGIDEHPTVETFPATPKRPSAIFVGWLVDEILKIYIGENQVPND